MRLLRRLARIGLRLGLWALGGAALLLAAGAAPVVYVETACRSDPVPQALPVIFTRPADQRPEARSFLVYPEWHVVYAYEEMAAGLEEAPAHGFDFARSIAGFWSSLCALRAEADRIGDPGQDAKITIYTVGLSFTVEMIAKAAYEESLGRLVAALDGSDTPQDAVEREMARAYGHFLHQTPWYLFDFDAWTETLWEAPIESRLRGWERRLALGAEWQIKASYARAIAAAVAEMDPDVLTMSIHVTGLPITEGAQGARVLGEIPVRQDYADGVIIEVDRYRRFTQSAQEIAAAGGTITEIAGNDDILISVLGRSQAGDPGGGGLPPEILDRTDTHLVRVTPRVGMEEDRYLLRTKVPALTELIRHIATSEVRLEHIYDY